MTHGFPLSFYGEDLGLLPTTLLLVEKRLSEGRYVPLATEARGIYEIAIGTYFLGASCKSWLEDYYRGSATTDIIGGTPVFWMKCSALSIAVGAAKLLPTLCTAAGCTLAYRSITQL